MKSSRIGLRGSVAFTSIALASTVVTACSSSGASGGQSTGSSGTQVSTPAVNSSLHAKLPAAIKQKGSMSVGINAIFAPMEFTAAGSTTLQGFDVDYANAIGGILGVKIKFDNQQFSQLVNSVTTGRVDMVLSGITDNKSREKALDFIDYFNTGTQVYMPTQNASSLKTLADLCGKTMAMSASTDYVTTLTTWSQKNCVANGKGKITILGVDSEPSARLQMTQKRAVASAIGPEVFAYLNKQNPGKYATLGPILNPGPYGIAFTKKNTGLRDAVLAANTELFKNGTYQALLKKWGLTRDALDKPTINAATS